MNNGKTTKCVAACDAKVWKIRLLNYPQQIKVDSTIENKIISPINTHIIDKQPIKINSVKNINNTSLEHLQNNARDVLNVYKQLPYQPDIFRTLAKISMQFDTAVAYQIIDTLLAKPQGDMFFMYPLTALYLHGKDKLPKIYLKKIQNCFKNYTPLRGNTENHWLMYYTSIYLLSYEWLNEQDFIWFNGKSSAENYHEAKTWLQYWHNNTQKHHITEFNSPLYGIWYLTPLVLLHDFAPDSTTQKQATRSIDLILQNYVENYFDGFFAGAYSRVYAYDVFTKRKNQMTCLLHFLLGDALFDKQQKPVFVVADLVIWSLSSYTLPEKLQKMITNPPQETVLVNKYRLKKRLRYSLDSFPEITSYVYRNQDFTLSSTSKNITAMEQHRWHLSWKSSKNDTITGAKIQDITTLFSLHPHFSDYATASNLVILRKTAIAEVAAGKPFYIQETKWVGSSEYETLLQNKNTLVALYDFDNQAIPYKHYDLFFPNSLLKEEKKGWIFGADKHLFVAIFPLKSFVWLPEKYGLRL
jgi:hypothetical protein